MKEITIEEILRSIKVTNLYFSKEVVGEGQLHCLLCGHTEQLNGSNYSQCEECWEIQEVTDNVMCGSNGKLEQNKPVFCPRCHSYSVRFIKKIVSVI